MYFKNWESSTDQQHKFLIDLVYFSGQRKNDKQMKKLYSLPGDNKYVEKIKQAKSERRFAGSRDSYELLSESGKPLIRWMNVRPEELRVSVM